MMCNLVPQNNYPLLPPPAGN